MVATVMIETTTMAGATIPRSAGHAVGVPSLLRQPRPKVRTGWY
jgi:hypothetical protein